MFQPHTTDTTKDGLRRARNAMRLKLWNDDAFAHMWLVHHPHGEDTCPDGCDQQANPQRVELYQSELEAVETSI